jgi:hypothetical protein
MWVMAIALFCVLSVIPNQLSGEKDRQTCSCDRGDHFPDTCESGKHTNGDEQNVEDHLPKAGEPSCSGVDSTHHNDRFTSIYNTGTITG